MKKSALEIEKLGNKSQQTSEIVALINGIDLGFSAVADIMRKLTQRTSVAANEIARSVKTMLGDICRSVNAMKVLQESVQGLSVRMQEALSAIEANVWYVDSVTDLPQRIATATKQQSSGSEDVSQIVEKSVGHL